MKRVLLLTMTVLLVSFNETTGQTVARQWNEALLDAIRIDFPAPTVHARNLYHTSAAMYDAWSAFDPVSTGTFYTTKHTANDVATARNEAISYAAYRVLSQRYALAVDPKASQVRFDDLMSSLGYDNSITTTVGDSPAAIGNRIAAQILGDSLHDGSNEANGYVDNTGYVVENKPMVVDYPDVLPRDSDPLSDPNRWQPLFVNSALTQNGLEGEDLQVYIGPHWGGVTTFAMNSASGPYSWSDIDPGPPPQLYGVGDQQYRDDTVLLINYSNALDPAQGPGAAMINISPNTTGNRPLGTHDDQGYAVNPVTGQPYADNWVKTADYGRVLAEFWADGPESETPPGHWNVIANEIAEHPLIEKRIGGVGPVVDDLEWDVKTYLALNGATHDAAVAAWGSKREYNYVRPITKIRFQGSLGQSSDPGLPNYHPDGLPLVPGTIEQITAQTIAVGGRHRNAYDNANQDMNGDFIFNFDEMELTGKVVIKAWNHEPVDPATQVSGTDWILAQNWVPYQSDNFVTPAFAAYVSGHSTFSRAAAEVLTQMTGSPYFPGGLGEMLFDTSFLEFEVGPSSDVLLQWATYYDAADEAGISRLWGGIHVPVDDFLGRIMGSTVGVDAFAHALSFFRPDGDFDADGDFDCADVDALVVEIAQMTDSIFFDLTGDGTVDGADLTEWLAQAGAANLASGASYLVGDANLDGTVDGADFVIWNANKFQPTSGWCSADFNADGVNNGFDFVLWNSNKFTSAELMAVPEPISIYGVAALLFATCCFRRRPHLLGGNR